MANLFTGHKDEWKALADIDYFGAFVKAYIPFNAWMNISYPALNTDREKINEIKRNSNTFRDKICALLNANNQDGSQFRGLLGELHDSLENHYINNQDKRITFTNVTIGKNPRNISEDSWRGIGFRVQYGNGATTETQSLIKRRNGTSIFHLLQPNYDIEALRANAEFVAQNQEYKSHLLNCYKDVEPYIQRDFTTGFNAADQNTYFECGNYKFIKEPENLAKGLIEIIYNLRNSLFHGELVPNKEANQVYGAAYRILYLLIQSL